MTKGTNIQYEEMSSAASYANANPHTHSTQTIQCINCEYHRGFSTCAIHRRLEWLLLNDETKGRYDLECMKYTKNAIHAIANVRPPSRTTRGIHILYKSFCLINFRINLSDCLLFRLNDQVLLLSALEHHTAAAAPPTHTHCNRIFDKKGKN